MLQDSAFRVKIGGKRGFSNKSETRNRLIKIMDYTKYNYVHGCLTFNMRMLNCKFVELLNVIYDLCNAHKIIL